MQRRTIYLRATAVDHDDADLAFDASTVIDLRELDADSVAGADDAPAAAMPAVQPIVK